MIRHLIAQDVLIAAVAVAFFFFGRIVERLRQDRMAKIRPFTRGR